MNLSVSQMELAQALSIVSRAVSPRSPLPILENIHISAEGEDKICLSATNLELCIRCWIPARVEEEGSISAPSKIFTDLINALHNDTVYLRLDKKTQTIFVRCLQSDSDVKGIDGSEFPPMPVFNKDEAIKFEMPDIRKMINQVAFAASSDEARPILHGVSLTASGNEMSMVATDGFRIAVKKIALKEPLDQPISAIIPAKALQELSKVTTDNDKEVYVTLSEEKSQVIFRLANLELTSQLIAGTFIDYKAIIPKSFQTTTIISTASLIKACNQAMVFARDNKFLTRFTIIGGENGAGRVEVNALSEHSGRTGDEIEASVDGTDLKIAFNVRFLRDVLEVIGTPNVCIQTNTNMSPALITPMDDERNYQHVLMPMHLGA